MDRNFVISLIKFMDRMGMSSEIELSRHYIDSRGKRNICMSVVVYYKGNVEYKQYHCYTFTNEGKLFYSEGNTVKDVGEGILSYLGNNKDVDNYFDELARYEAKKYYKKYFS